MTEMPSGRPLAEVYLDMLTNAPPGFDCSAILADLQRLAAENVD